MTREPDLFDRVRGAFSHTDPESIRMEDFPQTTQASEVPDDFDRYGVVDPKYRPVLMLKAQLQEEGDVRGSTRVGNLLFQMFEV